MAKGSSRHLGRIRCPCPGQHLDTSNHCRDRHCPCRRRFIGPDCCCCKNRVTGVWCGPRWPDYPGHCLGFSHGLCASDRVVFIPALGQRCSSGCGFCLSWIDPCNGSPAHTEDYAHKRPSFGRNKLILAARPLRIRGLNDKQLNRNSWTRGAAREHHPAAGSSIGMSGTRRIG